MTPSNFETSRHRRNTESPLPTTGEVHSETSNQRGGIEPLLTIADAAKALGVHTWALRRAVKSGTVPAYAPFNGRKLVRLSEVVAAINASKTTGGADV